MGQALYRKYRSKSLSEIVGQEHVTQTLANALVKGTISHAYLFTGPRGVGKTSVARLLAHAVNKLPYDSQSTHLDIIEIDAASNRRIDEIRELRERIGNAPTSAKFKVYIIDEVHMLTKEAFNALLKTLEEPPEHVIFILATTEAHKLPETIVSRTQRFTFKPIDTKKAAKHLAKIAQKEGVEATDEALELIAKHGDGSFRDSISLLDQAIAAGKKIDDKLIRSMLGEVPEQALEQLLQSVTNGHTSDIVSILAQLKEQGIQAEVIAKQLAAQLRAGLISRKSPNSKKSTYLLSKLIEVPSSHDPVALLEIILLDASLKNTPSEASDSDMLKSSESQEMPQTSPKTTVKPAAAPVKSVKSKTRAQISLDESSWQEVLEAIKSRHSTLYGLARMAVPSFNPNELILEFAFPFHQKRLNEERNKAVILSILKDITGQDIEIKCHVSNKIASPPKEITTVSSKPSAVDNISNIFGSAEVLE